MMKILFLFLIFSCLLQTSFASLSWGKEDPFSGSSSKSFEQKARSEDAAPVGNPELSKLRGQVLLPLQPFPIPLRSQRLILFREQKEILRVMTDGNGEFIISKVLENGDYKLVLDSERYEGNISFVISGPTVRNIVLAAARKPQ